MNKTVAKNDIYNPNKEAFKRIQIRGHEYYYFMKPSDGKKIYATTPDELLTKVKEYRDKVKSLFVPEMTLKEAMFCWNHNIRYASKSNKGRFEDLLSITESYLKELDDHSMPFDVKCFEVTETDIIKLAGAVRKASHPDIFAKFELLLQEFIECLQWLGIKLDFKTTNDGKIEYKYFLSGEDLTETNKVVQTEQYSRLEKYNSAFENVFNVSERDLKSIDQELTVRNSVTKSCYKDDYIVVLITLHTGIYAKDAFYLRWNNIDLTSRRIITEDYKVSIDDLLHRVLTEYKAKSKVNDENAPLFPSAEKGKAYTNILTMYSNIKRNAMLTADISLRDLSLIKGKEMLNAGVDQETVAKILGIKIKGVPWERMEKIHILPDPENKNNKSKEELEEILNGFNEEQMQNLIMYAKIIKNSGK